MIRPLAAKCAPAATPAARFPRATSPGRRARSSTRTPSQPIAASKESALPPKTAVQNRSAFQSRPWTQPRIAEAITKAAPQSNPAPTIPRAALVSTAAKGDPLTTAGTRKNKPGPAGADPGRHGCFATYFTQPPAALDHSYWYPKPLSRKGAGLQAHLSSASAPRRSYQALRSASVTASRVSWQEK